MCWPTLRAKRYPCPRDAALPPYFRRRAAYVARLGFTMSTCCDTSRHRTRHTVAASMRAPRGSSSPQAKGISCEKQEVLFILINLVNKFGLLSHSTRYSGAASAFRT